jgi:hypothetical protein
LNDAFHLDATAMMQCCNAAGTRALYDLWQGAVEQTAGDTPQYAIHLRFSVATPALTVVSHEPATGMLEVTPKEDCRVSVRLPEGEHHALAVTDGTAGAQPLEAEDGYVTFSATAGTQVNLYYPLCERVAHYEVGAPDRTLRCTGFWRGETLMHVDPPGEYYPLYQRSTDLPTVQPDLPR